MFNIVLLEPEIPPNTGNIIRLAANTGSHLHLIEPMGFKLEDKQLRRAGLDYREWANVICYRSYKEFIILSKINRIYGFSTKAKRSYSDLTARSNTCQGMPCYSVPRVAAYPTKCSVHSIVTKSLEFQWSRIREVSIWPIRWRLQFTRPGGNRNSINGAF